MGSGIGEAIDQDMMAPDSCPINPGLLGSSRLKPSIGNPSKSH